MAPQREAAARETLNQGIIRNVLVLMITLLMKVVVVLDEGEAALEAKALPALWFPQVPMSCPLKRAAPRARTATQSKDSDNTSLCYRCGQTGHWAKICRSTQNVDNSYKVYREGTESHNMEQEDDDEGVKLRVENLKAGKNDETPGFT